MLHLKGTATLVRVSCDRSRPVKISPVPGTWRWRSLCVSRSPYRAMMWDENDARSFQRSTPIPLRSHGHAKRRSIINFGHDPEAHHLLKAEPNIFQPNPLEKQPNGPCLPRDKQAVEASTFFPRKTCTRNDMTDDAGVSRSLAGGD
ncbi:tumor suppressor p53-binding protein 1-like isoform X5 [Anopheles sinensis]|uniref:Tumor suppressor p53-binding protein 1-like isoform X5 n=1 Tax=Anopheles sinensis TaxID=74873 RepID=A0A084VS08_ANOSI|nr:tumor suppressor p53-binding protein 1-like isoform X5 [Anopheles sinensis]